ALMELLGNPHRDIPAVHITGTNGKGSTSRMLVELIGATGLDVGSYTSPHIDRVNDRIMIANEPLDDGSFTQALSEIAEVEPWVIEATGHSPSYFEVLCAAAYNWFAATAVDVNVIEVGMGGRWDATNVIDADVAVITNIGPDHMEIIGPTLADIAEEKAGIISKESHVINGESSPELVAVITGNQHREKWQRHQDFDVVADRLAVGGRLVDLATPFGSHQEVFLPVNGAHQAHNAAIAVAAAEAFFGRQLDTEVISEAFQQLQLPARFEIVQRQPMIIIDGAHNPPAASVVAQTLFEDFVNEQQPVLVMGANKPRDPMEFFDALRGPQFSRVIATAANWPRAIPADELGLALQGSGAEIEISPTVPEAIDRAIDAATETGTVLITGSLYVASEARGQLLDTSR
ncbi:MAG: Mur ligase family protein, partial [Actinomycetota bacterium]|nr:Mur ligase family protein [Actinomycetota bacterium]